MRRSVRQVSARHGDTVRCSGENRCLLAISLAAGMLVAGAAAAQIPPAIAAVGEATVVTLHAEGVQVYECKTGGEATGSDHKLAWTLRGPIAGLSARNVIAGTVVRLVEPSLTELAGTLALAKAYIGSDSGVSHLAACVGTPSVILYPPETLRRWAPWSPSAVPLGVGFEGDRS